MPYEFDTSGTNPANLIPDEQHIIIAPAEIGDYHFFVPFNGPFFESGLIVTHYPSGLTLTYGVDFSFGYKFITASISCGKSIYGAIVLYDQELAGSIEVTYQTLGGEWEITEAIALDLESTAVEDPRGTTWEEIVVPANEFPVVDVDYNLNDLIGEVDLIESIEGIASEVSASQIEYDAAMWEYVKVAIALQRVSRWYKQSLLGVTAQQIIDVAVNSSNDDAIIAIDSTGLIVSTNDDGLTWAPQITVTNGLLAGGNGLFVIIPNATINLITTTDGVNFSNLAGVSFSNTFKSFKFINNTYVAVGTAGAIITSVDGLTWTVRTSNTTETLRDMTWGDGKYVIIGDNNTLITSADLINWQTHAILPITDITKPMHIEFGNNLFIITNGLKVFISKGGEIWTSTATLSMSVDIDDFTFGLNERGLGTFVLISGGLIYASTEGENWLQCRIDGGVSPTTVKALNGKIMLTTAELNVLYRSMCVLIDTTVLSGGTPTYSQVVYLT